MKTTFNTCLVIPCFNEEKRLVSESYDVFLQNNPDVMICFVNDGSTDNTAGTIQAIKNKFPEQITLVSLDKNQGKAEAVRSGMLHCLSNCSLKNIAYLDADLSTSLEECLNLQTHLNEKIQFCFGSRILRVGAVIKRKRYRFLVGRLVATCISMMLDIKVYDTQCGCKMFDASIAQTVFKEKFISRWLFDVEIFFRLIKHFGKLKAIEIMEEVPLNKWEDGGASKIKASYFFIMWFDLLRINRYYKRKQA